MRINSTIAKFGKNIHLVRIYSNSATYYLLLTNALSFYGSKMILYRPNNFGRVPIVLDVSNLFWLGPNNFRQVQIIKIGPEKHNLNLTKMIWTRPKRFGPDQNDLDPTKTICTRPKQFGPSKIILDL